MMVFVDALQVIKYAARVKTHKQCRFTPQSAQQNSDSLYPQREGEKERTTYQEDRFDNILFSLKGHTALYIYLCVTSGKLLDV